MTELISNSGENQLLEEEILFQPLITVADKIRRREISPVEVTEATLRQIDRYDDVFKSYTTVTSELALGQAEKAEKEIAKGKYRGPMHGIPVAVKDLCFTKGINTTGGMIIYKDFKPSYDATVVRKLRDAGSILVGKLHMTEGATINHHPKLPEPVNPWRSDLWPGVSSSGSGIAAAAGMAYATVGSDTGGSIRFPSACNNLTGLKPTWGRVSRYGIFDLAPTLDHLGPMARSASDAAAMLEVLAGHDLNDPTTLADPVPSYLSALGGAFAARGVTVGIPREYIKDVDPITATCLNDAVGELKKAGANLMEVPFPDISHLLQHGALLKMIELAAAHKDTFPARGNLYGGWIRSELERGRSANAIEIAEAIMERRKFTGAVNSLFKDVQMLAIPVFQNGTPTWDEARAQILDMSRPLLRFTSPLNLAGIPAVTMPCGMTSDGRPVAFQLVGPSNSEALLLRVAHAYQQITDWHMKRPPLNARPANSI